MTTPVTVRYEPRGAARELFSRRDPEVVMSGPGETMDRPRRVLEHPRGVADRLGVDMAERTCGVNGCEQPHVARDLCGMHYQRMKKRGTTAVPPPRACLVGGCGGRHHGGGYCGKHHRRLRKTGSLDLASRIRQTCSFAGCGRPAVSGGLCDGHSQQAKKGRQLTDLRLMWKSTIRDESGHKRCRCCASWKPEGEFYPSPRHADGLTTTCKRCDRSARLLRNYGMTADQYDVMLSAQGGACAICRVRAGGGLTLHVDHDHGCCPARKKSCGRCVRGLLCEDCNRVLGIFRDDPGRFRSAAEYVTRVVS